MTKTVVLALACSLAAAHAATPELNGKPTYAKEVSRIIQKNCEGCHRPGQIGPFSLTNYREASAHARDIKRLTQAHVMPPWKAVKGFGELVNERLLSDADVEMLARWADAGAPMGNPKDLPPPARYNEDWVHGPPDVVLSPESSFQLIADGPDEYRCFVIPTSFSEDRTIQAIESRPGNRKIVHHVLIYTDVTGKARQLDALDPLPGYACMGDLGFNPQTNLGGWAPGDVPTRLPNGMGRYLPKGADLVMQVHYHKSGKPETDRTTLGVYFNREPVKKYVRFVPIMNRRIRIPAGDDNYQDAAAMTLQQDVIALSVFPHMHLLGKEMKMVAVFPDGTKKDLVWVKPWDFNWQTNYIFKEQMLMPKGTRIEVTAAYDNSEKNANNPNKPLREVRWGEATTDEMLIGWITYAIDTPVPRPARPTGGS